MQWSIFHGVNFQGTGQIYSTRRWGHIKVSETESSFWTPETKYQCYWMLHVMFQKAGALWTWSRRVLIGTINRLVQAPQQDCLIPYDMAWLIRKVFNHKALLPNQATVPRRTLVPCQSALQQLNPWLKVHEVTQVRRNLGAEPLFRVSSKLLTSCNSSIRNKISNCIFTRSSISWCEILVWVLQSCTQMNEMSLEVWLEAHVQSVYQGYNSLSALSW